MKKLHSFAFYALAAPAMTLCSGAALAAGSSAGADAEHGQGSSQHEAGSMQSNPMSERGQKNKSDHSRSQNLGYMSSAPANGLQASNLIGAEVSTTGNEDVGPVNDLIIDADGQVVGLVIGVGGFLSLGEKDVAIGWDDVRISGTSDEPELRIDQTRQALESAPGFERQD